MNSRHAGKVAGYLTENTDGVFYRKIGINGKYYYAHRIIMFMHGYDTSDMIDHVNGDGSDNRLENLRVSNKYHNGKNVRMNKNNKSGFCGVYQNACGNWYAKGVSDGKTYRLGTYKNKQDAINARIKFNQEHGFDERHGTKQKM